MVDTMDVFTEKQKAAIAYFDENLDDWLKDPSKRGKYAIIRDNSLVQIFDNFDGAILDAVQKYETGSYIIQRLISSKDTVGFYYPVLA
ncbi:hypothetical protein R80B4_02706 [Fibrobacteres bacterium R8-0-B4]